MDRISVEERLNSSEDLVKTDTTKCTEEFLLISVYLLNSCPLMDPLMHQSLEQMLSEHLLV